MSNPTKSAFILCKYSHVMGKYIHSSSGFYAYPPSTRVKQNAQTDGWKIIAQINIYTDEFGKILKQEFGNIHDPS